MFSIGNTSKEFNSIFSKSKFVTPGPTSYCHEGPLLTNSPCYSIPKASRISGHEREASPGPANYSPVRPLTSPPNYSFPKNKRPSIQITNITPGPGHYNICLNSRNKNALKNNFPKDQQASSRLNTSTSPGPANYIIKTEIIHASSPSWT